MRPTAAQLQELLQQRNALLVHFSAYQSMDHPEVEFPDDLHYAIQNSTRQNLRCSVICPGDSSHPDPAPGVRANSIGSVGLIVDFPSDAALSSVSVIDGGTSDDANGRNQAFREDMDITYEKCKASIDKRPPLSYNEWVLETYRVIGLFVFEPIWVRRKSTQTVDLGYITETITSVDGVEVSLGMVKSQFDLPCYMMDEQGPMLVTACSPLGTQRVDHRMLYQSG